MENEINQDPGQQANQQPGQEAPPQPNQPAGQEMPPYPQMNPGMYPYPPFYHHHRFWGKKVTVQLWKCLLAGGVAVILAFSAGAHFGREIGNRRGRMMAPYMMQMPGKGQGGGFYYNNGGGGGKGSYQLPNNQGGFSQRQNGNNFRK